MHVSCFLFGKRTFCIHNMFDKEKIRYIRKTINYLKRYKKWSLAVLAFSFLSSFFESFSLGTLVPLFQSITSQTGVPPVTIPIVGNYLTTYQHHPYFIAYVLAGVFIMIILKNIFFYLNTITINKITNYIKRDLQTDLFNYLTNTSLAFFNSMKSSHLIGTISTFAESIAAFIFSFLNLFILIARLTLYTLLLLFISWKITVVLLLVGLLFLPILKLILTKIRQISLQNTSEISKLYFRLSEMFTNISLMKIFGTETYEKNRFKTTATNLAESSYYIAIFSNILSPLAEIVLMGMVCIGIVYLVLVQKMSLAPYFSLAIAYTYIFLRFFNQANAFLGLFSKIFQGIEPFRAYEKVVMKARRATLTEGIQKAEFKQSIVLENVGFSYTETRPVLTGLNFSISKGSFVAFVGSTGSGKTTIANLLMGLYIPTQGSILIDGIDLKELNTHEWRKKIGYVYQETALFNDSILNNIRYGSFDAPKEEVVRVAKIAQLHEFIAGLPEQYDTMIGERGVKLSGGQKQRLSIARALIHHPEILIFDEATSALDTETEKKVQEGIFTQLKDCTIIAIAHRLSTVQSADSIFVLRDGRIVEQGNHQTLLEKHGYYNHLYQLQLS